MVAEVIQKRINFRAIDSLFADDKQGLHAVQYPLKQCLTERLSVLRLDALSTGFTGGRFADFRPVFRMIDQKLIQVTQDAVDCSRLCLEQQCFAADEVGGTP